MNTKRKPHTIEASPAFKTAVFRTQFQIAPIPRRSAAKRKRREAAIKSSDLSLEA